MSPATWSTSSSAARSIAEHGGGLGPPQTTATEHRCAYSSTDVPLLLLAHNGTGGPGPPGRARRCPRAGGSAPGGRCPRAGGGPPTRLAVAAPGGGTVG